ncbi:MAG: thioredoxin family protein [Terracidiphilus sp.]
MRAKWVLRAACGLALACATARPATRDIYPDPGQARADIAAAVRQAAQTHKRVLLDFGGDWCGDCMVLEIYLHSARNAPILNANFVLVHVNVGQLDQNLDIAGKYGVPVQRGVPEVAVLSEMGKLLYSTKDKALELAVQRGDTSAVTSFLLRWKPGTKGCSVVEVSC